MSAHAALRQILTARGLWNDDGISRRARPATCRTCGAHTIRGLDADTLGVPTTVDPTPLDTPLELVSLITHRPTYTLDFYGRPEITRRSPATIANGVRDAIVLPTHQCHRPLAPLMKPATETTPTNDVWDPNNTHIPF